MIIFTSLVTKCALRSIWWGLKSVMTLGVLYDEISRASEFCLPDFNILVGVYGAFSDKSGTIYCVGTVCLVMNGPYSALIVTGLAVGKTVNLK